MKEENKITAYKGFDKDLKCRDFQYEVGKAYEMDGEIECYRHGFEACENPLDIFLGYYNNPEYSRYCKVEQSGVLSKDTNGSSTMASSKIHVQSEIGLKALIEKGAKFIADKVVWEHEENAKLNLFEYREAVITDDRSAAVNEGFCSTALNTGERSAAVNVGFCSAALNTGCHSAALNAGDYSVALNAGNYSRVLSAGSYSEALSTGFSSIAKVEGKDSIAIVTGSDSMASGALGCWLVLTERDAYSHIKEVKAVKVDGKNIKPDTYYELINGEVKEAKI